MIELDLLIPFFTQREPLLYEANKIFLAIRRGEIKEVYTTTSVLLELDLWLRSHRLPETRIRDILDALRTHPNLRIVPLQPDHLMKGNDLRRIHGLTYWDSIHCSVCLGEDKTMVGTDRDYEKVPGLTLILPAHFLRI
jgi:predicted nucleic acid-binding protein